VFVAGMILGRKRRQLLSREQRLGTGRPPLNDMARI
jgi:hypothetical protein